MNVASEFVRRKIEYEWNCNPLKQWVDDHDELFEKIPYFSLPSHDEYGDYKMGYVGYSPLLF